MASLPPGKCCGVVFDHEGTPEGSFSEICGLETYVTGEKFGNDKVVVILTDIYGHKLKNTQLVADQLAKISETKVVIPDILKNDPLEDLEGLGEWLGRHGEDVTGPIVKNFLGAFKKEFGVSTLFGLGFCFGAKYTVLNIDAEGILDGGAIAHPSFVTPESVERIAKPIMIASGDKDVMFTPELRTKTFDILSGKEDLRFEVHIYSGAPHGYVIKGDLSNKQVKYAKEKTIVELALWFTSF